MVGEFSLWKMKLETFLYSVSVSTLKNWGSSICTTSLELCQKEVTSPQRKICAKLFLAKKYLTLCFMQSLLRVHYANQIPTNNFLRERDRCLWRKQCVKIILYSDYSMQYYSWWRQVKLFCTGKSIAIFRAIYEHDFSQNEIAILFSISLHSSHCFVQLSNSWVCTDT